MSKLPSELARERFTRLESVPMRSVGAADSWHPRDWVTSVRDLVARRDLLDLLIRRDLKAKYKDSALGFFWSLARPLMQLLIYFVVVGQFLGAARGIPDFAIYIFTGLTAIGLFTEIVISATGAIVVNSGLVKKVYVPRELFPLASVGSALFNFAVQFGILLIAIILSGALPWHRELMYAVPAFLVLVVYGMSLGLIFSAVNVYLRDVQYLVEVGTMLLFWASPVVYSWQMASQIIQQPFWLEVYTNNPLTLAVIGFQRAFWLGGDGLAQPEHLLTRLLVALGLGVVALLVSHRIFLRLQGNFAQEL